MSLGIAALGELALGEHPSAGVSLVNAALASNGATVSASSTLSASYPASAAINGDRTGAGWGTGTGGWNDNTPGSWPDYLEVQFSGSYSISKVDVIGLQDNFSSPIEPTPTLNWALYGIDSFRVEYWTGSAWATIPGTVVSSNSLVWRSLTFSPVTTSAVRLVVTSSSGSGYSRVVEFEAWGEAVAGSAVAIAPSAIASAENFGSAAVISRYSVAPSGIGDESVFGTPSIRYYWPILVSGIVSAEVVSAPVIGGTFVVELLPAGIPSAEALGIPSLGGTAVQELFPAGIPSSELFGGVEVTFGCGLQPVGIVSAELFGSGSANFGWTAAPESIESSELFGAITVAALVPIQPTGIVSGELFGSPIVLTPGVSGSSGRRLHELHIGIAITTVQGTRP
jgi:hypothetical protein